MFRFPRNDGTGRYGYERDRDRDRAVNSPVRINPAFREMISRRRSSCGPAPFRERASLLFRHRTVSSRYPFPSLPLSPHPPSFVVVIGTDIPRTIAVLYRVCPCTGNFVLWTWSSSPLGAGWDGEGERFARGYSAREADTQVAPPPPSPRESSLDKGREDEDRGEGGVY